MQLPLLRPNNPEDDYDPFDNPPQLSKALRHAKANSVGTLDNLDSDLVCQCCFQPVEKKQLDLRCLHKELVFLGSAVVIYFEMIKVIVVLLVLLFFSAMGLMLIFQSEAFCCPFPQDFLKELVLNPSAYSSVVVSTFGLAILLLLIFFVRKYYENQAQIIQKRNANPSHFAVLLMNLPNCDEDELKGWIKTNLGRSPIAIHQVVDTQQLKDAFQLRQNLTIQLHKNRISNQNSTKISISFSQIDGEILGKKQHELLRQIEKQDAILNKYRSCFKLVPYKQTGSAFVIFQTANQAKQILAAYCNDKSIILKLWGETKQTLLFKDKKIQVLHAPSPKDTIWQNLTQKSYCFQRVLALIFVMIKCSILGLSVGSGQFIVSAFELQDDLSWRIIGIIMITYSLHHFLLHCLITTQIHVMRLSTHTEQQVAAFWGYGLFNLAFGCLLPYNLGTNVATTQMVIYLLLFIDGLVHPFLKFFNGMHIYHQLLAQHISRLSPATNPYTQDFLQRLIVGRPFRLGESFHFLFRALGLSVFYAHAAPLSFLSYALSISIEYCTEKYLLLRKCSVPPKLNRDLSDNFMQSLSLLPVIYIWGVYQFDNSLQNSQTSTLSFIVLLLGAKIATIMLFFLIQFPTPEIPSKPYSECEKQLSELYQLENPIKRYNGQLKYNQKLFMKRSKSRQKTRQGDLTIFDELFLQQEEKKVEVIKESRVRLVNRLISFNTETMSLSSNSEYRRN